MKRVALWVSYDGTNFSGYQVQPQKRTVQEAIEKAISTIHKGRFIRVHASGRTDATVHAEGQVIHFDTELSIPEERWPKALNSCLPHDIRVVEAAYVSEDFHARYSAVQKEYHYHLLTRKREDVFRRNTAYHFPYELDLEKMEKAASLLIGTHDFSSFCAANTDVIDKVRTLHRIDIEVNDDQMIFKLVGNGFLYNMVRIIVGTLLDVGIGKIEPEQVEVILETRDRSVAGKTAPGHGLYLWKVSYPEVIFSHEYN